MTDDSSFTDDDNDDDDDDDDDNYDEFDYAKTCRHSLFEDET